MPDDLTSAPGRPFDLGEARTLLAQTPGSLEAMLGGLPPGWSTVHEGPGTWSPFDILGHLIHGERTDWIPRARIILEHGEARAFEPFDRFAQFEISKGRSVRELLDEFARLRAENLEALATMDVSPADLERRGRHPDLGAVTLRQLLATWVAHDLAHLAQVARVVAVQYAGEVGPWRAYMRVFTGDARR